jgi:hypothetical protein
MMKIRRSGRAEISDRIEMDDAHGNFNEDEKIEI